MSRIPIRAAGPVAGQPIEIKNRTHLHRRSVISWLWRLTKAPVGPLRFLISMGCPALPIITFTKCKKKTNTINPFVNRVFPVFLLILGLSFALESQAIARTGPFTLLFLYDAPLEKDKVGVNGLPLNVIRVTNVLGHFSPQIAHVPVEKYYGGLMAQYDVVLYLGERVRKDLPASLIADVPRHPKTTVVWLRHNIEALLAKHKDLYAFDVLPLRGGFETILYEERNLSRMDYEQVYPIVVRNWDIAHTEGVLKSDLGITPFCVHAKNLWYFADSVAGGTSNLVFCDLLHDVLEIPHEAKKKFFVRIEDIHPMRDPNKLRRFAIALEKEKVPFMLSVIPVYRDPKKKKEVKLAKKHHLVEALKECAARGGSIVMHGYTHQWEFESGEGHEFWDVPRDRPIAEYTDATVHDKMNSGIRELTQLGLYPLAWETPHYSASDQAYRVIAQHFSTAVEARQLSNASYKISQSFPFIVRDVYGQTIIPENLGYINLETGEDIPKKLAKAQDYLVLRDAVVGMFYHPYYDPQYLMTTIAGLKKLGFEPFDLRDIPSVVTGENTFLFSGLATEPYPFMEPARRITPSVADARLLEIPMDAEWLHSFLMDYQCRPLEGDWSKQSIQGSAIVSVPNKTERFFVVEKLKNLPPAQKKLIEYFRSILLGHTGSRLETAQRWMIWGLFLVTAYLFLRVLAILLTRTSHHKSHFRKGDGEK